MTEQEMTDKWLSSPRRERHFTINPAAFFPTKMPGRERLMRLTAIALARHPLFVPVMRPGRTLDALTIGEAFADGNATAVAMRRQYVQTYWHTESSTTNPLETWAATLIAADAINHQQASRSLRAVAENTAKAAGWQAAGWGADVTEPGTQWDEANRQHILEQAATVVAVLRPEWKFDAAWRTSSVTALAAAIYASREYDRMPVLADALEESGCNDPRILDHCRGAGPFFRGEWILDHCAGKR